MDSQKASVNWYLDKRREKVKNGYPVKLSVYFDGQKKFYPTGIDLTKAEWEKLNSPKLREEYLKIAKRKLHEQKDKAQKVIDTLDPFTFVGFEEGFYEERQIRRLYNLEDLFTEYIAQLKANDQVSTAVSYQTTKNSINKFKPGMKISDVSREFVTSYERHMTQKGLSPTTISINLRQLRCILNKAIAKGLMKQEKYPFKGYQIPNARNVKKALTEDQIKAILNYKTNDPDISKALDFWIFSYISNGINMKDVCLLQPENLQGDFFYFFRAKTKNTKKKDLRPIKVPLTERTKGIIDRWRNRDSQNPYLFPVLEKGLTATQIMYKVQDFISFINEHMKLVAKDLEIDSKLGTYVARHSHSTILMRKGVPTALIKENLGHSSILTTENYLSDFLDDEKHKYAKLLDDF